jgi:hypothetical protein
MPSRRQTAKHKSAPRSSSALQSAARLIGSALGKAVTTTQRLAYPDEKERKPPASKSENRDPNRVPKKRLPAKRSKSARASRKKRTSRAST